MRPWACSRVHTSLCAARGQARGWATAVSAGVHEGGMERNSAAYVFDVSFTLTEAGLAAAPGARPRSARSTRRSRTRGAAQLAPPASLLCGGSAAASCCMGLGPAPQQIRWPGC